MAVAVSELSNAAADLGGKEPPKQVDPCLDGITTHDAASNGQQVLLEQLCICKHIQAYAMHANICMRRYGHVLARVCSVYIMCLAISCYAHLLHCNVRVCIYEFLCVGLYWIGRIYLYVCLSCHFRHPVRAVRGTVL